MSKTLASIIVALSLTLLTVSPLHAQTTGTIIHPDGSESAPGASADFNADAWPDNPFASLNDGDLWLASTASRHVAALRWSGGNSGTQTVMLSTPTQAILLEAPGTIAEDGEIAILLAGAAPDLESLFGSGVASNIGPLSGAEILTGGLYIEISVLISPDGGATFDELDPARLQSTPVRLRIEDLTAEVDSFPVLYEHPTYIASDSQTGLVPLAESGTWTPAPCITLPYDETAPEDTAQPVYLEADLRSLSVFVPLDGTAASENGSENENGDGDDTDSNHGTIDNEIDSENETLTQSITEETTGGETVTNLGTETLTLAENENGEGDGGGGPLSMLLQPGDPVWADFGYKGIEKGTEKSPFNTLAEAAFVAATIGSDTVKIDRVTPNFGSAEAVTIAAPLTIEAVNGPVRIGKATRVLYVSFTQWGAVTFDPVGTPMEGTLPYAVNPEYRVYDDGDVVLLDAYPADGLRFKGWWSPNTDFTEEVTEADLLPATKHRIAMDRDRYVWALYEPNTENYDLTDNDGDGLTAYRETEFGTSDSDDDSDDDGLPDGWEVNYDLNPLSGAGADGPTGDPDEDSVTNLDEFIAGTSPRFDETAPPPADEPPPPAGAAPNLDDLNPDFNYTDFSTATGIVRSGDATLNGSEIRLVPEGETHAGAVWTDRKMPISKGFTTSFTFDLKDNLSDGISFVIQNASATPSLTPGGLMGYTGMANSIAVEFDTFHNFDNGDPLGPHISIHMGQGGSANNAHESYSIGSLAYPPGTNFTTSPRTMTIQYNADNHTLTVPNPNGGSPLVSVSIDLETALSLDDGKAYIGIVSTTGDPDYTTGPNVLLSWSADFITSRRKAELRRLRVSGVRTDTGATINELDNRTPTSIEDFDGGFIEWGQPNATPHDIEIQEDGHLNRGEYPRSFDVFFDQVANPSPNDGLPAPFNLTLEAFMEGGFPETTYNMVWSFDTGSVVAGAILHLGETAVLEFTDLNQPEPGLYKIKCEARYFGESSAPPHRTAVAYILLPDAGPEITDWLIEEARQIAGPNGVGERWLANASTQAINWVLDHPIHSQIFFDSDDMIWRYFTSISSTFDYTDHMKLNGVVPSPRFNFYSHQRRSDDPLFSTVKVNNDNSFATMRGLVVSRPKITDLLWALWGRSVGISEPTLLFGANVANLQKGRFEDWPTNRAYLLGFALFDAVQSGMSDQDIREQVLTVERVRDIRTDGSINDTRLWPRGLSTAEPNTGFWSYTGQFVNINLYNGQSWGRPIIFKPSDQMDLNPLTW